MLDTLGPGRMPLADRAYDSDDLRPSLVGRGATANIKPLRHRLAPAPFSASACRARPLIARFFSKLKHFRAVATRYDKHPDNHLALVQLAAVKIRMPLMSR